MTDWWLAGPWKGKEDGRLLGEPPFDPAEVVPKSRAKLARRAWEPVQLESETWTDLDQLSGRGGDLQLWCLATTLSWTPEDQDAPQQIEAWLWLELEDGWSVWLDGEPLSHERRVGAAINGDVRIPLQLTPGEHRLVILVEDVFGAAAFGARLTDPENGPPEDGLQAWSQRPDSAK